MARHQGIPAEPLDIIPAYLRSTSNQLLFVVMEFDQRIDIDRLGDALAQIHTNIPLTRAKLCLHTKWPVWKPCNLIGQTIELVSTHTWNSESLPHFISRQHHDEFDTALRLWVMRGNHSDTLCVGVDHTLADAAGARALCYLLAKAYSSRIAAAPATPGLGQNMERSHRSLTDKLSTWQKLDCMLRSRLIRKKWQVPIPAADQDVAQRYAICSLDNCVLARLKRNRKRPTIKINDMLLAAFFLAAYCEFNPANAAKLALNFTVDLRRYLADNPYYGIANLSGTESIQVNTDQSWNFDSLVEEIARQTTVIKRQKPGLAAVIGVELLFAFGHRAAQAFFTKTLLAGQNSGHATLILTNLGYLDERHLQFEDANVCKAYMVGPSLLVPGVVLSVSGFRQNLTLSMGYNQSCMPGNQVDRLVSAMASHLEAAAHGQIA